jgi:hypothetical protein
MDIARKVIPVVRDIVCLMRRIIPVASSVISLAEGLLSLSGVACPCTRHNFGDGTHCCVAVAGW